MKKSRFNGRLFFDIEKKNCSILCRMSDKCEKMKNFLKILLTKGDRM